LLFPLEDSIKEYYHHTEEETEDYEPYTTVFNPRIIKHCDLRGDGVENGFACDLAEGILSGVCFALSEMGVEGAGGGVLKRPDPLGLKCDTITSPRRLVNTFIHQMIPDLLKRDKPIKVANNFKSWSTTRDISSEWG
jgi:hypothetical protein